MKTIDIYANGPVLNFETLEDLKQNVKVRKTLFNEDGSVKNFYFYEEPMTKRNPLNNRFRIGLFENVTYSDDKQAKWKAASIETDTTEEMMSALEQLNAKRKRQ